MAKKVIDPDNDPKFEAHRKLMEHFDQKMQRGCPGCGWENTTGQPGQWPCGTRLQYGKTIQKKDRTKTCFEIGRLRSIIDTQAEKNRFILTGATDKSVRREVMRYCIPCNTVHSLDWCRRNGEKCSGCGKALVPAVLEETKTVTLIGEPKGIKRIKRTKD